MDTEFELQLQQSIMVYAAKYQGLALRDRVQLQALASLLASMKHHEYTPLDVETANPFYPGFRSIEEFEQQAKASEEQGRRKRVLITCCILGSIFSVLLVLAITTTKPYDILSSGPFGFSNSSSDGSSTADQYADGTPQKGIWNEGGHLDFAHLAQPGAEYVKCKGSELRCGVVNRLPIPEADFRNLSRRAEASEGMVAADSSRCSEIGRDVLSKQQGNAIDAAVAVALCQGVVNPVSSGLGGGAFIMVRLANGSDLFIDARETAPGAANATMFTGLPANASLVGPLAVAVPGELQGLAQVHQRFGVLPWSQLVAPGISLAREGFAAHPYLVYVMSGPRNLNRIAANPELRKTFLIRVSTGQWRVPHVGELCCKRPKFAETLHRIATEGPSYLSRPDIAQAMAAELQAAGGIITADDFTSVKPVVRQPLRVQIGDVELLIPPPPSSAAVVAFALKFLAGYGNTLLNQATPSSIGNASSSNKTLGPNGEPLASFGVAADRDGGLGLHRLVEAMKHGFAVRTALGDPGTTDKPYPHADSIKAAVADLLSDKFVDSLRAITKDDGVLPDTEYGGRWNPEGVAPAPESGTSHFSIVDKDRNAVSVTTSVNGPFGAAVVSTSTGIMFGNTMDDFAQPNKSSIITPHPAEANFIAAGKRPLSAMSPIIVSHKPTGRLLAVAGASGGPLIVSATLQTLARLLLEGADVSDAVSQPRVHDQLLPVDDTYYENYTWGHTAHQLSPALVEYLKSKGQVPTTGPFGLGVAQAISVRYNTESAGKTSSDETARALQLGLLIGQSDARKDGAPVGY